MCNLARLAGFGWVILTVAAVSFLANSTPTARADDDHGDYRTRATAVAIGAGQVPGQIDATSILFDVDYFSFEALRGVRYTFVLELVTVEDANILVVNSVNRGARSSPGQVVSREGNQKKVEWIARTTDTYFVEVSGTRNNADGSPILGSYSLNVTGDTSLLDRYSEARSGAIPINVDNVYQAAISPWTNQPGLTDTVDGGDDHDYFFFQASRGVKYTIDVELGTAEGVEITILKLSGGTEVSNGGVGTSLQWVSPVSAIYYVEASGSSRFRDSVGTYSLKLSADTAYEDRHSQTHIGATSLSFDNAHLGAISPEDDTDVFSFLATRGVRYEIRADLGTAQGIDLSVEEPGGNRVASNGGVGARLGWIAPASNIYFVVVSGSSQVRDPVGTYSLIVSADTSLEDRHGETAGAATSISFGNEHRGAISPASDRDYFGFSAERGVVYTINVVLGTAEAAEITVTEGDGTIEVSNGGIGVQLEWTAPASGAYYVVVAAPPQVSDPVGTYGLRVETDDALQDRHGETRESATRAVVGSTYRASISPEGDKDYFTFQARRGVRYVFELTYGTAGAVSLTVDRGGSGSGAVARNYGEGTDVVWTAPDNEEYFVAVSGSPRVVDPTGTYLLTIRTDTPLEDRHSDLPAGATQIIMGNAMAGAVSPPEDYDYFFFDATQGEEYVVLLELGTAEAVRLSVTHSLAGFSESNYGTGTSLAWEAPITGRYIVLITASGQVSDPVGTYQITINTRAGVPPAATPEPTPPPTPTPTPTPTPAPTPGPTPVPPGPALIVESRTAPSGGTVLVPVMLKETEGLTSLGFTVNYDPSVAELVNVRKGARLSPATFSFNNDVPGAVRLGFAATTELSGGGSAAIMEFRVIGEHGAASPVTLVEVLAGDSGGGRLSLNLVDGRLTVGEPMAGDGDGDGQFTALDALIALRMFMGQSPEALALDVDRDGSVTLKDAQLILVMARPE